jgi:hypothetical protein
LLLRVPHRTENFIETSQAADYSPEETEVMIMARYGKKAGAKVKRALHKKKSGTLKSGRSGRKVKSRKQAIAIGLSEARKAGGKVPPKKKSTRKSAKKK